MFDKLKISLNSHMATTVTSVYPKSEFFKNRAAKYRLSSSAKFQSLKRSYTRFPVGSCDTARL